MSFDPCGVVMGVTRSCYSRKCRFYSGQTPVNTRIRYYFADENAAIYTGTNVFHPQLQLQGKFSVTTEVGEISAEPYTYDKGARPPEFMGVTPHGSKQAFSGQLPWDEYSIDGEFDATKAVSCKAKEIAAEIHLGGIGTPTMWPRIDLYESTVVYIGGRANQL